MKSSVLFVVSFLIVVVVFLKNAWVSDDAYILFRSIEQLFAGNGPNWNPHERVQVFTSPLWYVVLCLIRVLSNDYFLNVILLSLAFLTWVICILGRLFKEPIWLLLTVGFLAASTAFFDYTSSGLENCLAYLILALFILYFHWLFEDRTGELSERKKRIRYCIVLFGLIVCVRHDLLLLLLPATCYLIIKFRKVFTSRQWVGLIGVSMVPLVGYTIFSTLYYGFPFPNTAYAKLNTGIPKSDLITQGLYYFKSSLVYDTVTLLVIFSSLILNLVRPFQPYVRYLCIGIILSLAYVLNVGGDFMQGRFFSYAYFVSTLLLVLWMTYLNAKRVRLMALVAVAAYLLFYPHTPLNSPIEYSNQKTRYGIADERGFYFNELSLKAYLSAKLNESPFPTHPSAIEGRKFRESDEEVVVQRAVGFFGYFAGTEKIILDPQALSDPLLARLPSRFGWRIGHFERAVPAGYLEGLKMEGYIIENPQIREFHRKLLLLTQEEALFSFERLKTIFLFNTGAYDYLLSDMKGPEPRYSSD